MKYIFLLFYITLTNAFMFNNYVMLNGYKDYSEQLKPRIAIIGSTGKLGSKVIRQLSKNKIPIKILNRYLDYENLNNNDKSCKLMRYYSKLPNIQIVNGDINDKNSLIELLKDCDTCLSLQGSNRISKLTDIIFNAKKILSHPINVNYYGIKNLLYAANKTNTKHIIRISGNGENPWKLITIIMNTLGSMCKAWNYAGECLLREQINNYNISYTIIRPGIMGKKNCNENLKIKDNGNYLPITKVSYNSIANLCISCIGNNDIKNCTLTAMSTNEKIKLTDQFANIKKDYRFFPNKTKILKQHYLLSYLFISVMLFIFKNIIYFSFQI